MRRRRVGLAIAALLLLVSACGGHLPSAPPAPGAPVFTPGTEGVQIIPAVAPLGDEPVVVKHFPNAFRGTRLQARQKVLGTRVSSNDKRAKKSH